jgi:Arc/MetJ-type ribon-helix-helix transcriptional regulator
MAYKKISISIDERTYAEAKEAVDAGDFRSFSQLFEDGAKKLLQQRRIEKSGNPCEASA